MDIEKFKSMDGYTFDEGVAFLVLCNAPRSMVRFLTSTHNAAHLHAEINKMLRMPATRRILAAKGVAIDNARPEATEQRETAAPTPEVETPSQNQENSNPTEPAEPEQNPDPEHDIILTRMDVRSHENTRYEDMPNDLCRNLWLRRQDLWREMQQAHLKMRSVPEGSEHDGERAKWRKEIMRLDAEIEDHWQQIDAEIQRFKEETERAKKGEKKTETNTGFDLSTYRSYVSKALRKKKLSPAEIAELQHRVDEMVAADVKMKPETVEKLKAVGISFAQ